MSQDFESPEPNQDLPPRKPGPKLKLPVPPNLPDHDPEHGSPMRRLSTLVGLNMMMLLASLGLLGYIIYERFLQPPGTQAAPDASKAADQVKPEVDRLKAEIEGLAKKLEERAAQPDSTSQIKSLDEKIADLGKTVAEIPAKFDSINQKLEAVSKGEGLSSAPKVDAIEKRVGDISHSIEAIKAELAAKPAATRMPSTVATTPAAAETAALDQAIDIFKKGRFAEAKDAFTRLQATLPDDARVWYFSALANGLTTRDWKGESERLVATGIAREKAGSPDRAKIDAAFADLTATTGKDWLAYYRRQAAQ